MTRFLSEASFLRALTGKHVVRILDAGHLETGVPFLALERLAGRDLGQVIKACGHLAAPIGVDYALQACIGLAEAHARGLIHYDVKPANLQNELSRIGVREIPEEMEHRTRGRIDRIRRRWMLSSGVGDFKLVDTDAPSGSSVSFPAP